MLSDTKSSCKKTTDDPNPSEGKHWRLAISGKPNRFSIEYAQELGRENILQGTGQLLPISIAVLQIFLCVLFLVRLFFGRLVLSVRSGNPTLTAQARTG